ncbi:C-type lectin domain family 4 member M-like [Macrobrachium nipponense]|uniref:C-type lectin domain family 4 member M-like n=1 Tax=Macrobrachium nipponense TaxID=159736 RepID=UPI0030C7BC48
MKGCEAFSWNLTSGAATPCAIYATITGLVNTTGVTTYLSEIGLVVKEGFAINYGKILLPAPVGVAAMDYQTVVQWCISKGTTIFIPRNTEDWNFMVQMHVLRSYSHIWIPMTDIAVEGTYVWQDGTSTGNATYVTWGGGLVGSGNSNTSDCVAAHSGGANSLYVHADPCTFLYNGFVCVKK